MTPAQKPRRNGLNCIRRRWIWFSLFLFAFLRDLFIFPRWCWHLYYPKNPNCDEYDSGSQRGSILSRYFLPRFTIVRAYSPWIPAFCNPRCHWDFLSLSSLLMKDRDQSSWAGSPFSPWPMSSPLSRHCNGDAAAAGDSFQALWQNKLEILSTLFTIKACICLLHCIDTSPLQLSYCSFLWECRRLDMTHKEWNTFESVARVGPIILSVVCKIFLNIIIMMGQAKTRP